MLLWFRKTPLLVLGQEVGRSRVTEVYSLQLPLDVQSKMFKELNELLHASNDNFV